MPEYVMIEKTEREVEKEEGDDEGESIQEILRPLYIAAQLFGIFPLYGISSGSPSALKFRWFSLRTLYSLTVITASSTIAVGNISMAMTAGIARGSTGGLLFFIVNSLSLMLFLRLATKWPEFLESWARLEKDIKGLSKVKIKRRVVLLSTVILSWSLVEHGSSNLQHLAKAVYCSQTTGLDGVEHYFTLSFREIFTLTPYSLWKGVLLSLTNLIDVIVWNFTDLFIMVLSLSLSTRFRQLNIYIERLEGKKTRWEVWKWVREQYNNLYLLTKSLDSLLSSLLALSFASNLFFICLQLLNSLRSNESISSSVYFYSSLLYLIGRAGAVCLCAATVNDEYRRPLSVLFSLPPYSFNSEVERLVHQIQSEELSLTGAQFFSITRGLLLTIGGTIVTYEIVLVQFNALNSTPEDPSPVNTTKFCPDIKF